LNADNSPATFIWTFGTKKIMLQFDKNWKPFIEESLWRI